jgi:hypothetical protein
LGWVTNMKIILLVEPKMCPIPKGVKTLRNFGMETVIPDVANEHVGATDGQACLLEAEPKVFQDWLRPFDGVWTSNNPMVGWQISHIR